MFFEVCTDWALYMNFRLIHLQNGPIRIHPDYSVTSNDYSWNKLADYFWIDQPVYVLRFATFHKMEVHLIFIGALDILPRMPMDTVSPSART